MMPVSKKTLNQVALSLMTDRDRLRSSLERATSIKAITAQFWKDRLADVEAATSEVMAALERADSANPDDQLRHKESEFYRLLRRVFLAQMNGDYDLGGKLEQILSEDGAPKTEQEFDARMEAALKAMGAKP